ncbi:hypothetical protein V502_00958 [Pseudogymnoascus sp. VKM F-4520 (FW-2644)]|nr:hypothetical protein V502_00958 [Pseudogymnoascus sp. VKM F-4520 (FW-2644)]
MDLSQQQTETVPTKSRSRSNTAVSMKSRKRQLSRGSTTSLHSAATHSLHDQQTDGNPAEYQKQWFENEQQQRFADGGHVTAEDMVMQSASQLRDPRDYGIDPALGAAVNHTLGYSHDGSYRPEHARRSLPTDGYGTSFMEDDSPMLEGRSDEQDDVDSLAGANGAPKKASKSSAANELEMRQLFQNNKHRKLPEVATELHGNERGPQSERMRQVFAMIWINQVCDKGKGSVPRGRVYANYVSRCATERVTVLNPASFGKLVRVLFPGLKTRRLGVRGESKYHYVNFSLKEDQPNLIENPSTQKYQPMKTAEAKRFAQEPSLPSHTPVDKQEFPGTAFSPVLEPTHKPTSSFVQSRSLYNQSVVHNVQDLEYNGKITQHLCFVPPADNSMHEYEPITLPKIEPFIPAGTDPDSATALTALYRSHCTSLVDAIRFVKQKTFFYLFTSFHGTLTMPVQKLFAHESIAPWIEECDFVMYQKMIRLLGHLTLEVVPQQILDTLHAISERLVSHIQTSFHGQPAHVIDAKVAPATLFAGLLDRMCRVNLTAHAAANMLSHPPNRDQMYQDWISMVRLRKVAECIPTRAMDDVARLLLTELRDLLDPVTVAWEIESVTPYGDMSARNVNQRESSIHLDSSTENVLDRWVNFLVSIPGRFSYASPADIIWCVERVGTAVMRDLTIKSGQSFGSWWVTKCWIDEMISFMAEKGGFMEYKTSNTRRNENTVQSQQTRAAESNPGVYNGGPMDDFERQQYMNGSNDHGITIPGPMDTASSAAMNVVSGHDDSGIGMRTPDDEFSMSKFNFSDAQMGTPNMDGTINLAQAA